MTDFNKRTIAKAKFKRNKKYYEMLGPSPQGSLSLHDFYRFEVVRRQLCGTSVLDVGCARADFLKLIQSEYEIAGIEVTKQRVEYCIKALEQDVVKVCDLEEKIDLEDSSYDTVSAMEVLEHLVDPQSTLRELVRISKQRVVITVPFNEQVHWLLCVHCAEKTPYSGHLHSFNKNNIESIVPDDGEIVKLELIHNNIFRKLPRFIFKLPFIITYTIDKILNRAIPKATWMMVVLDKQSQE